MRVAMNSRRRGAFPPKKWSRHTLVALPFQLRAGSPLRLHTRHHTHFFPGTHASAYPGRRTRETATAIDRNCGPALVASSWYAREPVHFWVRASSSSQTCLYESPIPICCLVNPRILHAPSAGFQCRFCFSSHHPHPAATQLAPGVFSTAPHHESRYQAASVPCGSLCIYPVLQLHARPVRTAGPDTQGLETHSKIEPAPDFA